MASEIERKYLVQGDAWRDLPLVNVKDITQAYIVPGTPVFIDFKDGAVAFLFHAGDEPIDFTVPAGAGTADFTAVRDFPNYDAATNRLDTDAGMVFRIRTAGPDKGFVTIKRPTDDPAVNEEYELSIPYDAARRIQSLACEYFVAKKRHVIDFQGMTWEVDAFSGPLHGLVIAEVEASDTNAFKSMAMLPGVVQDVTDIKGISNYALGRYGMPQVLKAKLGFDGAPTSGPKLV